MRLSKQDTAQKQVWVRPGIEGTRPPLTFGIMSGMNFCPPKPGSLVITRTMSTRETKGTTSSTGVPGVPGNTNLGEGGGKGGRGGKGRGGRERQGEGEGERKEERRDTREEGGEREGKGRGRTLGDKVSRTDHIVWL